ncbi:unnamed protein product [Soboliphyme baturini]|uniref:Sulfotransfer_1 domain-containing protein n=1 Tax=Soboliphyme baturini TaxID=241478 RepID=A0A183JAG0_9BILA|nr:unnamed protein product [Soboliphyme baturini]
MYRRLPAVLKEADHLGIEVIGFEKFSRHVERVRGLQHITADDVLRRKMVKHSPHWLKDLKQPMIKIEDRSNKFRPQYQEFQQWPTIVLSPGTSPLLCSLNYIPK